MDAIEQELRSMTTLTRVDHLIKALNHKGSGHICEFGVWKGRSLRILAKNTAETVWGFDSFEGLPEDWDRGPDVYKKGHFATSKKLKFRSNVKLVKGLFESSLPIWLEENLGPIGLIHVDCDLYSSTKTALTLLNDRIVPGTVVVFDELISMSVNMMARYQTWDQDEYKALLEWAKEFDREFELLARAEDCEVSIKITK